MDMLTISSGSLCAIGYDSRDRMLQVQLKDGRTLQYSGVGEETWRRLRDSASPWSFYRDHIEEEFAVKSVSGKASSTKNPLDDLFGNA